MKEHIIPSLRLTGVCILLFMGLYPCLLVILANAAPAGGRGEKVIENGRTVGYRLEGQRFDTDRYFWSRPSAVSYNASASGASNAGPSNPVYLATVAARIDTFMSRNPGIHRADIPSDMVTASGSGLDPDISVQGALIQTKRIAAVRGLSVSRVTALVQNQARSNIYGFSSVNVLQLNLALDKLR
jgi:K+-transporting ATPase ATPase C chain